MTPIESIASHIVGGDITYRYVRNDTYEIKVFLYVDCINGNLGAIDLDRNVNVSYFNTATNAFISNDELPVLSEINVEEVNYKCLKIEPNACVKQFEFSYFKELHPGNDGITIAYQRCCRNKTISNITNPASTGATFFTKIPPVTKVVNNSSAVFKNLPPNFLCTNAPLVFDHSATDSDGDSLIYSLIIPYLGATAVDNRPVPAGSPPYQKVQMKAPYNVNNMMNGSVLLNINASTGLLQVTPSETGQFVMAILVEEYRNGIKIAEVHRDYQLNVIDCVFGVVSDFQSIDTTCNKVVNFNNLSQGLSLSYEWDFGDTAISSDVADTRNTSWVYEKDGRYTVVLVVKNQDCTDTFSRALRILPEKMLSASFSIENEYGCDSLELVIQNLTNSDADITWDMGDGFTFLSDEDIIKHVYLSPGEYTVNLSVIDTNSCNQKDDTSFKVKVITSTQNNVSFETEYTKGCFSDGKVGLVSTINGELFAWDLGDGYSVENTDLTEYIYESEGEYEIKLVTQDTGICVYNDSMTVQVDIDKILKNSDGFEIYNVFTPDGDSHNECYQVDINHANCLDLKYKIYNRYGEVVFIGESVNDCWDGTHYKSGNSLPASEYFGVFTFTPEGEESFVISNIISLIR